MYLWYAMKLTIWFLSILMLLQSTSIGVADILRIDQLIEHAELHKQEYGDSLWVFISKHYGDLQKEHMGEHPHNSTDHSQLPFHHNGCVHMSIVAMLQETPAAQLDKVEWADQKKKGYYYQEPSSNRFVSGIFQPPKHA